ncbi:hypothetical protein FA95DRAFT_1555411 [Auriscalpium vulgare]|uniref:Uncharacterized protein n=1 Tax=Auriscalpium vulgare TaxID=40419 RepID=A0ACB8S2H1_9AGAM|nr:hypothetical protein FA95DRAFT_1555411 [Auriscalpium vulgare]
MAGVKRKYSDSTSSPRTRSRHASPATLAGAVASSSATSFPSNADPSCTSAPEPTSSFGDSASRSFGLPSVSQATSMPPLHLLQHREPTHPRRPPAPSGRLWHRGLP